MSSLTRRHLDLYSDYSVHSILTSSVSVPLVPVEKKTPGIHKVVPGLLNPSSTRPDQSQSNFTGSDFQGLRTRYSTSAQSCVVRTRSGNLKTCIEIPKGSRSNLI